MLDALFRTGGECKALAIRLVFERMGDNVEQFRKGLKVLPLNRGLERSFNQVVARDEDWIGLAHERGAVLCRG